ncbi:hypothetical protein M231_00029 [Tremella mesenterica]|uniref:BTB domain-containing protein n=1 Tax=Tremella mesenterica TaxID=5217 RepID=A0A4Q1BWD3_TREME|nr:hypothetical protein M231_00029 [Tremella mesenterica]
MSNSSPSTRLPRPSPSRSVTYHKASKSKPHPKVLPFPDLPVRAARSVTRPGTPLTLSESPNGQHRRIQFDSAFLDRTGSGSGAGRLRSHGSPDPGQSSSHATSPGGSLSPPSGIMSGPTTPISLGTGSSSSPFLAIPPTYRSRSQTSPDVTRPRLPATTRVEGFQPPTPIASAPLPPQGPSHPSPSPTRPASLPDQTPTVDASRPKPSEPKDHTDSSTTPVASSVPLSSPPVSHPLAEHLYQSFLRGQCADVRLIVRKWGAGWLVHRMILVQAGFFHSMFLSGFSEGNPTSWKTRKGKERAVEDQEDEWTGDDIELQFDDPNITRAAFEICLSRLYSAYPHFHYPKFMLPTPKHPLSLISDAASQKRFQSLRSVHTSVPAKTHLVTPRLLLSLIATSSYLGHTTLLKEVLGMVLRTISPATIGRYLAFAIGDGIGGEEWSSQNDEGARNFEHVSKPLKRQEWDGPSPWSEDLTVLSARTPSNRSSADSNIKADDDESKVTDSPRSRRVISDQGQDVIRGRLKGLSIDASGTNSRTSSINIADMPHFYGFASNKIGEACVCWLARWGGDVLQLEETFTDQEPPFKIWAHGGIPAVFARAVLSSDSFFVENEMERYRVARRVLDLRRTEWEKIAEKSRSSFLREDDEAEEWEVDEDELGMVFEQGIYYSHMTFDDLSTISSDIDPNTSLPYAPLAVLQAAHWAAADLRSRVQSSDLTESDDSTHELGLTKTTSEITAMVSRPRRQGGSRVVSGRTSNISTYPDSPSFASFASRSSIDMMDRTTYHPIPSDDTHRMGAGGLLFLSTSSTERNALAGVPDLGPDLDPTSPFPTTTKKRPVPQGEKTFFGLSTSSKTAMGIALSTRDPSSLTEDTRWTRVEPFRFSVEFWGAENLVERERLYSATHFYAGSWFNVYVQTIKKKDKGAQLGIYLHRQNPDETFPPVSAPPDQNEKKKNVEMSVTSRVKNVTEGGLLRTLSTSPVGVGSPPTSPRQEMVVERLKEGYRDTRQITKAYFSISCASALGTALIRFSSAPDSFTLSQSWGWKSSALRSEEYLSAPLNDLDQGVEIWSGEMDSRVAGGSLRATVEVGVI